MKFKKSLCFVYRGQGIKYPPRRRSKNDKIKTPKIVPSGVDTESDEDEKKKSPKRRRGQ